MREQFLNRYLNKNVRLAQKQQEQEQQILLYL